jgi:hypothetical protein
MAIDLKKLAEQYKDFWAAFQWLNIIPALYPLFKGAVYAILEMAEAIAKSTPNPNDDAAFARVHESIDNLFSILDKVIGKN